MNIPWIILDLIPDVRVQTSDRRIVSRTKEGVVRESIKETDLEVEPGVKRGKRRKRKKNRAEVDRGKRKRKSESIVVMLNPRKR